eukprot:1018105-Alexandrium_andersonii.AAC.1
MANCPHPPGVEPTHPADGSPLGQCYNIKWGLSQQQEVVGIGPHEVHRLVVDARSDAALIFHVGVVTLPEAHPSDDVVKMPPHTLGLGHHNPVVLGYGSQDATSTGPPAASPSC